MLLVLVTKVRPNHCGVAGTSLAADNARSHSKPVCQMYARDIPAFLIMLCLLPDPCVLFLRFTMSRNALRLKLRHCEIKSQWVRSNAA